MPEDGRTDEWAYVRTDKATGEHLVRCGNQTRWIDPFATECDCGSKFNDLGECPICDELKCVECDTQLDENGECPSCTAGCPQCGGVLEGAECHNHGAHSL